MKIKKNFESFFVVSSSLGYQHLFEKIKNITLHLPQLIIFTFKEDAQTEFFNLNNVFLGGNRNTEIGPSNALRISIDYQYPFINGIKLQLGEDLILDLVEMIKMLLSIILITKLM